jgi:hypothetical protein
MNEEEEEEGRPMTEDGLSIGENGLDDCGKNFGEWLKIPPKGRKDEKNWAGGREEEEELPNSSMMMRIVGCWEGKSNEGNRREWRLGDLDGMKKKKEKE